MTPEERAAALIGRIDATTDTDSLARMIAEEIRAAVEERDDDAAPQLHVAIEPPRVGVAVIGKPADVPSAFKVVSHPALAGYGGSSRLGTEWRLHCRVCATDEPEPGKAILFLTPDGYYCESCVYDEYVNMRSAQLSLFPVQYLTKGEVEDALREELYSEDGARPDDDLIERLTREISEGVKSSQYLKPLPDLVSMLMREVYYRTLYKYRHELPAGYTLPRPDIEP